MSLLVFKVDVWGFVIQISFFQLVLLCCIIGYFSSKDIEFGLLDSSFLQREQLSVVLTSEVIQALLLISFCSY